MSHEGFTGQHRAVGRAAGWAAFLVGQVYAVVSGLGFVSLGERITSIDVFIRTSVIRWTNPAFRCNNYPSALQRVMSHFCVHIGTACLINSPWG